MTHVPAIRSIVFMFLVFSCMLPGRPLVAQDNPCTLSGVVSDPTGASIPNAQVSARDSSGAATTAFSDAGGMYTLTLLPGEYRIEVSAAGFQTSALNTVKVVFGRPLKHDVQLEVAAVTEQVRVTELPITSGDQVAPASHKMEMRDWIRTLPPSVELRELLTAFEKGLIERALEQANGVQAEAARMLGLSRSDIGYKVTKYAIARLEDRA